MLDEKKKVLEKIETLKGIESYALENKEYNTRAFVKSKVADLMNGFNRTAVEQYETVFNILSRELKAGHITIESYNERKQNNERNLQETLITNVPY